MSDEREFSHRVRTWVAVILVVATSLLVPVAVVAVWAERTVASPEPFVAAVDGVISDPVVIEGTATWLTDQIFAAIGPVVLDQVPRWMRPLVRSRTDSLRTKLHDTAVSVLSSEEGQRLVLSATVSAHAAAWRVLEQDGLFPGEVVRVADGAVTLDLVPVAGLVVRSVQQDGYLLPGSAINETITTSAQIASLFGVEIADDFGELVVYRNDAIADNTTLTATRDIVATLHRDVVLAVVLTILAATLAVLIAVRRRLVVLWCGVGVVFVGLVAILFVRHVDGQVGTGMSSAVGSLAASSMSASLSASLQRVLLVTVLLAAAVAVVSAVVGRLGSD